MTDKIEINVETGVITTSSYTPEEIAYRQFLEEQIANKIAELSVDNGN